MTSEYQKKAKGFRDPSIEFQWAQEGAGNVAFLRHKIAPLERRESSDWDIAVRDLESAHEATDQVLGSPLLSVSRVYVEQHYYRWGQVDFLPSFQWTGFVFLESKRFWNGVSLSGDGLPRPRLVHDAFIAWLTGLLNGGVYRSRYDNLLQEAWKSDEDEFHACLNWAFGSHLAETMVGFLKRKTPSDAVKIFPELRRALRWRSIFRSPGASFEGVVRHWSREIALHVNPPFPWLAFLGPEGVGKSLAIQRLEEALEQSRLKTMVVHWGPDCVRKKSADSVPSRNPQGRGVQGAIVSTFTLAVFCVRWCCGMFSRTWHQRAKEKVMVSNRYYADLLVDPKRYRYGGSRRLARLLFRFLPKPDLTMILLSSPAIVAARDGDAPEVEGNGQIAAYQKLAEQLPNKVVVVDVDHENGDGLEEIMLGQLFKAS